MAKDYRLLRLWSPDDTDGFLDGTTDDRYDDDLFDDDDDFDEDDLDDDDDLDDTPDEEDFEDDEDDPDLIGEDETPLYPEIDAAGKAFYRGY